MARLCPDCHKGIYTSLNRIKQVIEQRGRDSRVPALRAYQCPEHTGWYHLTSQPRRT